MLKVGIKHVGDNGDGFFSKSRFIVVDINESGVMSDYYSFNSETKKFEKNPHNRMFIKWNTGPLVVYVVPDENKGIFDFEAPEYVAWQESYSSLLAQYNIDMDKLLADHDKSMAKLSNDLNDSIRKLVSPPFDSNWCTLYATSEV